MSTTRVPTQGKNRRFIGHSAVDGRQDAEWQRPLFPSGGKESHIGVAALGAGLLPRLWPRFTLLSKFRLHVLAYLGTLVLLSMVVTAPLRVYSLSGVEVALAVTMLAYVPSPTSTPNTYAHTHTSILCYSPLVPLLRDPLKPTLSEVYMSAGISGDTAEQATI